ncbi:MAG: UDP-N-acetylmuramoyl-tripeptide--D-alanyl-D-alanine ligase [Lentisphaerae bacterium]|nr:UDP-N-acetylmuramoyl-tripeptide--D-alanyl-D-alanine ligase [Lentisphaerota bacterium]
MTGQWLNDLRPECSLSDVITDTRVNCSEALFIALKGEVFDAHNFLYKAVEAGAAALCIEKKYAESNQLNFPVPVYMVSNTLTAYQELANYYRRSLGNLKIAAVTGSMGKTSTKEIIKSIFCAATGKHRVYATKNNTNNQVGVPQNIFNLNQEHRLCVLEMGTNHFGEIEPLSCTAEPDVALITSIAPCHLEFLKDLNGVASEKAKVFTGLKQNGTAVIPYQCPQVTLLKRKTASFNTISFGLEPQADVQAEYLGGNLQGSQIRLNFNCLNGESFEIKWKLSGAHQAINAAAAAAVSLSIGVQPIHIIEGLRICSLPGMRMKIEVINGINWVNDAYNASPESVVSALDWLAEFNQEDGLLLVLGDMLELGEQSHSEHMRVLNHAFGKFPMATFCLIGQQMSQSVNNLDLPEKTYFFKDSESACKTVRTLSKQKNTIFLKASRGMKLEKVLPEHEAV